MSVTGTRVKAGATAVLVAAGMLVWQWTQHPPPLEPLVIEWTSETPMQGHLFLVRVWGSPGAAVLSVTGQVAEEPLLFDSVGGVLESLAPVPIGAADSVSGWVAVEYGDGRVQRDTLRIGIGEVAYDHERLTVAPRFGSALGPEDQARLERDRALARRVGDEARSRPRLWGTTVALPRDDRVTSEFGTGRVFNGTVTSRHMGLDLAADRGDTIVAAAAGIVALVEDFLLAGKVVYLNHGGGLHSGYFHLSQPLVAAADTVTAGTPIGRAGATGRVTGPHLHWTVRYGRTSVDPLSLRALAR